MKFCRQLAKISRSTRGIVLLLCDLNVARRIMSEATRLKMTGGHFIWIWADTSSTAEFFQPFDVAKPTYEDEQDYRKQKVDSKYYQGGGGNNGNGRLKQQNQTRYKSINSSRYHHIIGLRKPSDISESISRDKRKDKISFDDSVESDKVNIKNINSNEFNANYYEPDARQSSVAPEVNVFNGPSEFDESHDHDYDYTEKVNPYLTQQSSQRGNNEDNNLDLDNYTEMSNDSKAKRADNSQSTFNISSHVFFHHFKDFPVGLLVLRHIKMNVDRVFVRSAIRLFASTWARVEKNEEIRVMISGGKTAANRREYDDYGGEDSLGNRGRSKSNQNKANNRYNNRGTTRKFKRDTQEQNTSSTAMPILTSVNTSINLNSNKSLSGLRQQQQPNLNYSGTETTKSNISSKLINDKSQHQKRSWWSPSSNQQQSSTQQQRARVQEKARILGTPQYKGGCFGTPNRSDIKKSEVFAR